MKEAVSKASVIACDLNACSEASLRLLSFAAEAACNSSPTVYIAVSNPLVWARSTLVDTYGTQAPASSSGQDVEDADGNTGQCVSDADVMDEALQTELVPQHRSAKSHREFTAAQFEQRLPTPGVESLYQAENAVLCQHAPDNLCTYVVCPGVLYGNGECITGFHDLFVKAWQADRTTALPVFGTGANMLPTVHVQDCASFVVHLARNQADCRYLFATDDSRNTQAALVKGISEWFASGEIFDSEPLSLFSQQVCRPIRHALQLPLWWSKGLALS